MAYFYLMGFFLLINRFLLPCKAGFNLDSDNIMERICNKTDSYIGRKHLSQCLFTYTPKKLLIIWEMCKKEVVGKVKFDELLATLCNASGDDKMSEWLECQDKYKIKGPASKMKDVKHHEDFVVLAMKCMVMDVREYD